MEKPVNPRIENFWGLYGGKIVPHQFYYQVEGDIVGPLTGVELRDKALGRQVQPDTLVRVDDSDFVPASRLNNLFAADGTPIPHKQLEQPTNEPPHLALEIEEPQGGSSSEPWTRIRKIVNELTKEQKIVLYSSVSLSAVLLLFVLVISVIHFSSGEWKPVGDGRTIVNTKTGEVRDTRIESAIHTDSQQYSNKRRDNIKKLKKKLRNAIVEFNGWSFDMDASYAFTKDAYRSDMDDWHIAYSSLENNRDIYDFERDDIKMTRKKWKDAARLFMEYKEQEIDAALSEYELFDESLLEYIRIEEIRQGLIEDGVSVEGPKESFPRDENSKFSRLRKAQVNYIVA